ncbi:MAG: hypothetical protein LM523_06035 [Candidatus Contendobacter sp.]|nr:hypothetical protein [Candidatus Contendobacter sp.]
MKLPLLSLAALSFASLSAAPALADTVTTPIDLGTLGGSSWATGASDTGSVVAGTSLNGSGKSRVFLWSQPTGMADLGTLGGSVASATGMSGDGSTIVGSSNLNGDSAFHAFRWTQATGMADLGSLGGTGSVAHRSSANGSVVVGWSYIAGNSYYRAFHWTQATGMVALGTLGGTRSSAAGVSGDGSIIAGYSQISGDSAWHAFRWTQTTGMADLGTLGGINSNAYGVSADGSAIVGKAQISGSNAYHAFRWTQAVGMQDIGTLGGSNSETSYWGNPVSGDGSVIVGRSQILGNATYHAFRWTQNTGMEDLNTLLSDAGVNMTSITLTYAYGISSNGQYIVGQGDFPGATQRAFLVCYDLNNGCIGLTTGEAQADSAQTLADDRRATMTRSRATANELLGMTRPMSDTAYVTAGGLFGSAVGYAAGQASRRGFTVLGGLGWGAQDYGSGIEQDNALTLAAALRYTLDKPFFGGRVAFSPYVELGGWATPEETLTLTRGYANGAGFSTGRGSADASSFAGYARGGFIWDATASDRLTSYGEIGRQYLSIESYIEAPGLANPFPASVDGGTLFMNVAKVGASWTHETNHLLSLPNGKPLPISLTLAGAAVHSFSPHTALTASLAAAGTVRTNSPSETWGEFGGRLSARFTQNLSIGLDLSGTAGADPIGTSLHGGASLAYAF